MSGYGFVSVVDRLRVALEGLNEAWLTLQQCEDLDYVDPFLSETWRAYSVARVDAENAFTDLAWELAGLCVSIRIEVAHSEEC